MELTSLTVIVGGVTRTSGAYYFVKSVTNHPLYSEATQAYDIALVELDRAVRGTGGIVLGGDMPAPGTNVTFVGWGDRYHDGGAAATLIHAGEPTGHQFAVIGYSHPHCQYHLDGLGLTYPECSAVCIKQYSEGGPCEGDVGSPTLIASEKAGHWSVLGVTSKVGGCGGKGRVTVATSLVGSESWIDCIRSGKAASVCERLGVDADTCRAPGASVATCEELGWKVSKDGVCARSNVFDSDDSTGAACGIPVTYETARDTCSAFGARLCRTTELEADIAKDSGCGLDSMRVWTRTPCGYGTDFEEMMTAAGSSDVLDSTRAKCMSNDKLLGVRCCADSVKKMVSDAKPIIPQRHPRAPERKTRVSQLTCGQLGWPVAKGSPLVCGGSTRKNGKCFKPMRAFRAKTECERMGARLCTVKELMNDEAAGSGCEMDSERTFSGNACKLGEIKGTITVAGSSDYIPSHRRKCSPPDTKLRPRCCADVIVPGDGTPTSWFSCDELGWPVKGELTSDAVCASSLVDRGCPLAANFGEAAGQCEAAGGRLCSVEELVRDVATGTGCQADTKRVWTNTPCKGGMYTIAGSSKHLEKAPRKCTPLDTAASIRCCADYIIDGPNHFRPRKAPEPPKNI